MLVSDFHFDLPPASIAQEPLADRASSRMLHLIRNGKQPRTNLSPGPSGSPVSHGYWADRHFRDFPDLLHAGDLLVLNNTRVFPARLYGHRSGVRAQPIRPHNPAAHDFLQGRVEVLLTRQFSENPNDWECLVHPGRKIGIGEKLFFGEPPAALEAEVIERGTFGERRIRFRPVPDFFARVERIGHVPLPPYIDREDSSADRDRYQTVYSKARGSVAAPTAGLHFTPEILDCIQSRGIEIAEITLHAGLGTFQPIRVEKVEDHTLHREVYEISPAAAQAINAAKAQGRRVIAVGTTTVRTLEFAASRIASSHVKPPRTDSPHIEPPYIEPGHGEADIFIYPGYAFHIVDALLTNFHLPQSTLLMLVCALAGTDLVLGAYRHAVQSGYRFYSYGDCMFIE